MQSITKYHRRIDDNPSHDMVLLLQVAYYAESRCHSEMQSPLPRLDAYGPYLRMRASDPEWANNLLTLLSVRSIASFACKRLAGLPKPSPQVLGHSKVPCVRSVPGHASEPKWAKNLLTLLKVRSIASFSWKRLAGLPRVCLPSFRPF